jgi:hypothetical protein
MKIVMSMKTEKTFLFVETIEVFKTNVESLHAVKRLKLLLEKLLPGCKINFDIEDCDKILRAKGDGVDKEKIIELMNYYNYFCEPLND